MALEALGGRQTLTLRPSVVSVSGVSWLHLECREGLGLGR